MVSAMTAPVQLMEDPTAVMGRRIGAYLIDFLVGLVILVVAVIVMIDSVADTATYANDDAAAEACDRLNGASAPGTSFSVDGSATPEQDGLGSDATSESLCIPIGTTTYFVEDVNTAATPIYLINFLTVIPNVVILQGLAGGTVGKLILGLRVVRPDGRRAGILRCTLRWVLSFVDTFCCGLLPGLALALNSKGHRRLGDMVAGTLVVDKSVDGRAIHVPGIINNPAVFRYQPTVEELAAARAAGKQADPIDGTTGLGYQTPQVQESVVTPNADAPVWDPDRNAYIQYDANQGAWVQWDDGAKMWRPIDQ